MEPLPPPPQSKRGIRQGGSALSRVANSSIPQRAHSGVLSVPSSGSNKFDAGISSSTSSTSGGGVGVHKSQSSTVLGTGSVNSRGRAHTEKTASRIVDVALGPDPIKEQGAGGAAIEAVFGDDNAEVNEDQLVEWQWGAPSSNAKFELASWGDEHERSFADLSASMAGAFVSTPSPSQPSGQQESGKPASDGDSKKTLDVRELAIRELVSTEKTYVESLKKLLECFIGPLTERDVSATGSLSRATGSALHHHPPLSKAEAEALFGQVEVILLYNTRLYEELTERVMSPTYDPRATKISDIFLRLRSFLQVYVGYAENYDNAMKCYGKVIAQNSKSKKLLKDCEQKAGNILEAFLILPIQRIPRYILLLNQIISHTDPAHPDLESLKQAVAQIRDLCSALNEAPKRLQATAEMLSVFKSIVPHIPDLMIPGRVFVAKERVWLINEAGKIKPRGLFIFNDTLLISRIQGDLNYLRFRIHLGNVEIHDTAVTHIDGKPAHVITLVSKAKRIAIAVKEESDKIRIVESVAKHNPTIMHGRPEFVALADRQPKSVEILGPRTSAGPASGEGEKKSSEGERKSGVAAAAPTPPKSSEGERKSGVAPPKSSDSTVLAALSGLLSRKPTSETPKVSRRGTVNDAKGNRVQRAKEEDFEIVRSDSSVVRESADVKALKAISPRPVASEPMTAESAQQKYISDLRKKIGQKREEQADMHRLVAFHRKYQDSEGEADALANIAKYDVQISELEASILSVMQSGEVPSSSKGAKTDARSQRLSVSTSVLPQLSDSLRADSPVSAPAVPHSQLSDNAPDRDGTLPVEAKKTTPSRNPFEHLFDQPREKAAAPSLLADPFSPLVADPFHAALQGSSAPSLQDPFSALASSKPESITIEGDAPPVVAAPLTPGSWCVALYKFEGVSSGELTFNAGDLILLVKTDTVDWFCGQVDGTGTPGWFPCSYVRSK